MRTVVGFVLINGCTFALDLGIVSLAHGIWGWPLPVSVTVGYAIAFTISFVLNRRFNFRSHAPVGGQLVRYVAVVVVNFVVILLGLTTGLNAIGVQYQLARIIAGACEGVFMYCMMRWVVFRGAGYVGAVTEIQGQGTPAPGWYADPTGQAGVRWWDGTQWTSYTAPHPAGGGGPVAAARPAIPATTPVYNPFIWLYTFLPLLSLVSLFLYRPSFRMTTIGGRPTIDPLSTFTPGYFAMLGIGLVLYALNIVFAALDHRTLVRSGVVRPFHWAFAFLGIVYTIGRAVIVHQVARPRGLAPIWITIGIIVVQFVVGIIWSVVLSSQLTSQLTNLPGLTS